MSNDFDHLRTTRKSVEADARAQGESETRILQAKSAADKAIEPMVLGVLEDFRKNVFPQMETYPLVPRIYEMWWIGIRQEGVMSDDVLAVIVFRFFSEDGTISALRTCLCMPRRPHLEALAVAHGLTVKSTPSVLAASVTHKPTKKDLQEALLRLCPPELLEPLLKEMKSTWRVGSPPRQSKSLPSQSGCMSVIVLSLAVVSAVTVVMAL